MMYSQTQLTGQELKLKYDKSKRSQLLKDECLARADSFSHNLLEVDENQTFDNPWHIRIIYDILDNILVQEPSWFDDTGKEHLGKIVFNKEVGRINRFICIEVPRNHAKSTAVSVNWVTKELYRDQNLRFVIASNVASQASSFLRETKGHLERGSRLHEVLGTIVPQYPEKWTDTQIIVNRTTKKKDASISTTGTGGAVLSKRADIVIFDDLLNPDNTRTPEAREKTKFWVNNVARPVLEPTKGRLVVIGTVWYKGDYLDERMADKTFNIRLRLGAFIKDSKTGEGSTNDHAYDIRELFDDEVIEAYGINAKDGVLWPERWPMSELEIEHEAGGTVAFNRQYMNIVLSEEEQIIKTEWLELAKLRGIQHKFLPSYNVSTCPYGALPARAMGVDLAISEKEKADYTVGVNLGKTKEGQIKLLRIVRGHFSPAKTREMLVTQHALYTPSIIKVENNAYQESLRKDMADYTDLPIKGYTTGGEKFDEYIGINSVGVMFENGKIDLPYSPDMPEEDRKLIDQFVYECESFSLESHTGDILMAFWFAINGLREITGEGQVITTISSGGFYRGRKRSE